MKKLVLTLLIFVILLASCASSPSASTPGSVTTPSLQSPTPTQPPSQYPADINGRVTVADKIVVQFPNSNKKTERTPLGNDMVWWIVEVSVKNNNYNNPLTPTWDKSIPMPKNITSNIIWSIVKDGKLLSGLSELDLFVPPPMSVSRGKSGNTIFLFEAKNISPSDAEIRYAGEEPYSYGKLTGGNKVAVYDWDLKKAVAQESKPTQVKVVDNWKYQMNSFKWDGSTININLTITNLGTTRRSFGYFGEPNSGDELAAIDSTDKVITAYKPEPKSKGEFLNAVFSGYPYEKEYYPNESWTGDLKFIMSPYSGQTWLCYGQYYWAKAYKLFDLGSPQ